MQLLYILKDVDTLCRVQILLLILSLSAWSIWSEEYKFTMQNADTVFDFCVEHMFSWLLILWAVFSTAVSLSVLLLLLPVVILRADCVRQYSEALLNQGVLSSSSRAGPADDAPPLQSLPHGYYHCLIKPHLALHLPWHSPSAGGRSKNMLFHPFVLRMHMV